MKTITEESLECVECPWKGEEEQAVFVDCEDSYFTCPQCRGMCAHFPADEVGGAYEPLPRADSEVAAARIAQLEAALGLLADCLPERVYVSGNRWSSVEPEHGDEFDVIDFKQLLPVVD
jgi:hypothetical protein